MSITYKVIKPGFFNGKLYDPEGKRDTLTVDKPFKKDKIPSWLIVMPEESTAVKAKREAQEASQTAATKFIKGEIKKAEAVVKDAEKALKKASDDNKAEAEKALADAQNTLASLEDLLETEKEETTQQQVAKASSVGDGAEASFIDKAGDSSTVETL